MIVADCENHRIQKFSPQGEFLETRGGESKKALEFSLPSGVGIHPLSKKVYIAESVDNCRVQVLDSNLMYVTMFGSKGSGNGQFNQPKDISFDSAGNCFVADMHNHRVKVFTEDGQYLRQFGKRGEGEGQLKNCTCLAIDSDIVYIADTYNHRISVFTTEGSFITSFGTMGDGPGQFNSPRGVTIDKNGLVYVSDTSNNCVQVF